MTRLRRWLARVDHALDAWLHQLAHPTPDAAAHREWRS